MGICGIGCSRLLGATMKTVTMIYKYRNWNNNNHQKILTEFELFCASPKSFNDPFDAKIFFDFENMSDEDYEKYKEKLIGNLSFSSKGLSYTKEFLNQYLNDKNAIKKASQKVEIDAADNRMGIISFSTDINNILLWSHYAQNHCGFAVGFDKVKIENSNLLGAGGMVQYSLDNNHPIVNPIDDNNSFWNRTFVKSNDWKYESEYRILRIFREKLSPNDSKRKVQFDPELINEVCLGMEINDSDKKLIIEICNNHKIPVYQMSKVPRKFEIEKIKCT